MSEVAKEVETAAPAAEVKKNPKPKAKKVAKATRPKSSHPTTAVMVQNAITELKERSGSSLQAIKKYIASTYKVDSEKMAPFIKKFLKSSVASGALVQTKGKGASGSFKLATAAVSKKSSAKPKKPVAAKSVKEAKPKTAKKAAVKPKAKSAKPVEKKPKATKAKSPKKTPVKSVAKSTKKAKSPARKSKAPKPKTTKSVGKKK